MRSRWKVLVVGLVFIVFVLLNIVYLLMPQIELDIVGKRNITISLNEEYVEEGASATYKRFFQKEKLDIAINNQINTDKVGKYKIIYKAKKGNLEKEVYRLVTVIDDISPEINVQGDVSLCKSSNLLVYTLNAYDNYEKDISEKVKYEIKDNSVIFKVEDSYGNVATAKKEIKVIDNESPVITLNGNKNIILIEGNNYEELGAVAIDSCDGDLTNKIKITNQVNKDIPGTYAVTYKVEDSLGNTSEIKRNVTVIKKEENKPNVENGYIYLTFDDGPGAYTQELLDILDKYNIKATFFVTSQYPTFVHLIKEEHTRGHVIGIHTYTHNYNIYSSVDTYLNDFYKIDNVIYEQIGIHTKLFRFPGGSSNTVSRSYKKGIMTELAKIMTEKGYIYFDWTFHCNDASNYNNSVNHIISNFKRNLKGDGEYVVLLHDNRINTIKAMPTMLEYALSKGYKFKVLDENSPTEHLIIAN